MVSFAALATTVLAGLVLTGIHVRKDPGLNDESVINSDIKEVGLWIEPTTFGAAKATLLTLTTPRGNTSKDAALKALKQFAADRVEEALIEGMKSTSPRTRQWASAQLTANP